MRRYNDEEYRALIEILINDTFYRSNSYDTRIQLIRKYTEIIIRRIANFKSDGKLTLGHYNTKRKLLENRVLESDTFFWDSVNVITNSGNERTHTQITALATQEEYEKVVESLFNLYAYLFILFFRKNPFGSNLRILSAFSILPPIIRYKALNELYKENPNNKILVEKYVLAILKAFDKKRAFEWMENHRNELMAMKEYFDPDNYYNILSRKVELLGNYYYRRGVMYKDFEGAVLFYREHGVVKGDSPDVEEFNSLMEFVYIGRKKREKELDTLDEKDYMINGIVYSVNP